MIDENNLIFAELGYRPNRLLPTGEYAGVMQMCYTYGLFVGLDDCGYRTRFCFETRAEAEEALRDWDGNGWPPGYWIKQKPEGTPGPSRDTIERSQASEPGPVPERP